MKIAFSVWQERIAPVLEAAHDILLVELDSHQRVIAEQRHSLSPLQLERLATWLSEEGATTLVCGALPRCSQALLEAAGLRVIPFVSGELDAIRELVTQGELQQAAFTMPGCCDRGRGRQRAGRGRQGGGGGRGGQGGCGQRGGRGRACAG